MSTRVLLFALVALVAAILAATAVAPASSEPGSLLLTNRTGSTPIDGRWRTGRMTLDVFVASARKVGASRAEATDFFHHLGQGTQKYARLTLVFRNGHFTEYQAGDGGPAVVGNEEPYQVRHGVLRLLGSGSESGCVASFRYVIRDKRLRLYFISVRGSTCPPASEGPHWGVALYTAAPFFKQV